MILLFASFLWLHPLRSTYHFGDCGLKWTYVMTTANFYVAVAPIIKELTFAPFYQPYMEGETPVLDMTCRAESHPPSSFYWVYSHDDKNDTRLGDGPTLQLTNLTVDDSGTYTCFAYNNFTGTIHTVNASKTVTVGKYQGLMFDCYIT